MPPSAGGPRTPPLPPGAQVSGTRPPFRTLCSPRGHPLSPSVRLATHCAALAPHSRSGSVKGSPASPPPHPHPHRVSPQERRRSARPPGAHDTARLAIRWEGSPEGPGGPGARLAAVDPVTAGWPRPGGAQPAAKSPASRGECSPASAWRVSSRAWGLGERPATRGLRRRAVVQTFRPSVRPSERWASSARRRLRAAALLRREGRGFLLTMLRSASCMGDSLGREDVGRSSSRARCLGHSEGARGRIERSLGAPLTTWTSASVN